MLNNGCDSSSIGAGRFFGSSWSIFDSKSKISSRCGKSPTSSLTLFFRVGTNFIIFSAILSWSLMRVIYLLVELKSPIFTNSLPPITDLHLKLIQTGTPTSISMIMTPRLQTSIDHGWQVFTTCSCFCRLFMFFRCENSCRKSGGIYSGVVTLKNGLPLNSKAAPKSIILTSVAVFISESNFIKIFSGFKSQWTICFVAKLWRPSNICVIVFRNNLKLSLMSWKRALFVIWGSKEFYLVYSFRLHELSFHGIYLLW